MSSRLLCPLMGLNYFHFEKHEAVVEALRAVGIFDLQ
jgi:hypothetical protein